MGDGGMERGKLTLRRDNTSFPQRLIQQLKIIALKQRLRRPIRITAIRDNHIILRLMILQILEPIPDHHIHLLMLEPHAHARQELLAIPDHRLINIHQRRLLHTLMLHHLPQHPAISSSNDEHAFRIGVREEAEVRDHFLVGEFVALGALDHVVEDEHDAVVAALEDEHVLKLRFLVVQDLVHFERHGLPRPHVVDFAEPAVFDGWVGEFGHGEGGRVVVRRSRFELGRVMREVLVCSVRNSRGLKTRSLY